MANLNLSEIEALQAAGDLQGAERAYLVLLAEHPEDINLLHHLGLLYASQDNLVAAKAMLAKAVALSPEHAILNLHYANVLKANGELRQAEKFLQNLIQTNPQYAAGYNNLGTVYFAQQRFEEAVQAFQKAIEVQENFLDAYYNLGLAYTRLQRDTEAQNAYAALLNLMPTHAGALFQSGNLYLKHSEHVSALNRFTKLAEIYPQHFETQSNLGTLYLKLNQYVQAQHHYLKALEIQSEDSQVLFNLGVISMQQHAVEDALNYYLRTITIDPLHFDALYNLGFIYLSKMDHQQALDYFQKALLLQPENVALNHTIHILKEDKNIKNSPPEYVRSLFDSYAANFDTHLLQHLHYQVPELMFQSLKEILPTTQQSLDVLDLGCGTGLCGELFKPYAKKLVGVDLSEKMLAIARERGIYDSLYVAEILAFLKDQTARFDLILAGDVLVYFGELNELFSAIHAALKPSGLFIFDIEKGENSDYQLTLSGRFAHTKRYIRQLAMQYSFQILKEDEVSIRTQNHKAVQGYLFVLRRS